MAGQRPRGAGIRPRSQQPARTGAAIASISGSVRCTASRSPQLAVERAADAEHLGQLVLGQRLAGPAPQHGAQLVVGVEADAVVDAVAVAVGHRQHVAALAVGVVDHDVEDRHPAQRRGVLVDERDRLVAVVDAVEDVPPAGRHRALARPASTASCSASGSCQTCTIPGPCGPSRSKVSGTTSQPSASETRRGRTSRSARVPSGKSHSGRSPAIGL